MAVKQFKWIDRDQAAHDLLQLVYHAPSQIRLDALTLLEAIRSPAIIPDLKQIVFDTTLDVWTRIYALRTIAHTPGDFYMLDLATLAELGFSALTRRMLQSKQTDINRVYFPNDLLKDIALFVDKHPSNRQWFWHELEHVQNPNVLSHFLLDLLPYYDRSPEFHDLLVGRWLNLREAHPHLMTIKATDYLYSYGRDKAKRWLNKHIDLVVETCCTEPFSENVLWVADRWKKLHVHLSKSHSGFEEQLRQYRVDLKKRRAEHGRHYLKLDLPDFRRSPVYQGLDDIYQAAKNGNRKAYEKLTRIATQRQVIIPIPVRAVATHFIGKLHDQYNSTERLFLLLNTFDGCGKAEWFPIRMEAGEALLNYVSAYVWERMINSFFGHRGEDFSDAFLNWISYLTDRLEGSQIEYGHKLPDIEQRLWFRVLAELPESSLWLTKPL
jgi:hypothetical protein